VGENWTQEDENPLASRDPAYVAAQREIERLKPMIDSDGLEEPFRMAMRDPELIAAGWDLHAKVRVLDEQLAVVIAVAPADLG